MTWGDNEEGQTSVPASAQSGVKAIAGGALHSLALKEDGSVVAWGESDFGQTSVPANLGGVKAIAAGYNHSLALKDTTPPAAVDFFDADAGEGRVSLSWITPSDPDFRDVRVLRSTTVLATGPEPNAAQTQVYEGAAESFTDTGLANGTTYYYTAYARDKAGNWSARAISRARPADTTAPETSLASSGPSGTTNSATATFEFYSSEPGASFKCSLDAADFQSCEPGVTHQNLGSISHAFEVRAVDAAGNTDPSPAKREWTVDATAPDAPGISSPVSGSYDRDGSFVARGTAEPGSMVRLYEDGTRVGTSETDATTGAWSIALAEVPDGSHAYKARATDAAGNVSGDSEEVTVIVDTTAPETTIEDGPSGTVEETEATFEFSSETGATFECSLDEADFESCESGVTYRDLSEESHTFEVRAKDAAGNADPSPARRAWTVDPVEEPPAKRPQSSGRTLRTGPRAAPGRPTSRPPSPRSSRPAPSAPRPSSWSGRRAPPRGPWRRG